MSVHIYTRGSTGLVIAISLGSVRDCFWQRWNLPRKISGGGYRGAGVHFDYIVPEGSSRIEGYDADLASPVRIFSSYPGDFKLFHLA